MSRTAALMLLVTFVLIIWDAYLYKNIKNGRKTISMVVTEFALVNLPFVFLVGFLMGHWFWPA